VCGKNNADFTVGSLVIDGDGVRCSRVQPARLPVFCGRMLLDTLVIVSLPLLSARTMPDFTVGSLVIDGDDGVRCSRIQPARLPVFCGWMLLDTFVIVSLPLLSSSLKASCIWLLPGLTPLSADVCV
jgi:hypothetical protein